MNAPRWWMCISLDFQVWLVFRFWLKIASLSISSLNSSTCINLRGNRSFRLLRGTPPYNFAFALHFLSPHPCKTKSIEYAKQSTASQSEKDISLEKEKIEVWKKGKPFYFQFIFKRTGILASLYPVSASSLFFKKKSGFIHFFWFFVLFVWNLRSLFSPFF